MDAFNQNTLINCININLINFHKYLHFSLSTVSSEWCLMFSHALNTSNKFYFVLQKQMQPNISKCLYKRTALNLNGIAVHVEWALVHWIVCRGLVSPLSSRQMKRTRTFYPTNNELLHELLCSTYGVWLGLVSNEMAKPALALNRLESPLTLVAESFFISHPLIHSLSPSAGSEFNLLYLLS